MDTEPRNDMERVFGMSSVRLPITRIDGERREANRKLGSRNGDDECWLCGRKVVEVKCASVHLSTQGGLIPAAEPDGSDDDQGWFPIGAECARSIPTEYRGLPG